MPLIFCDIHGASSGTETCQHIDIAFEEGKPIDNVVLPLFKVQICMDCYEQHAVKAIINQIKIDPKAVHHKRELEKGIRKLAPDAYFEMGILEEKHPELYDKLSEIYGEIKKKSRFNCLSCLEMLNIEYARKNNMALPFQPFENTILHSDDQRLDQLKALLDAEVERKGKLLPGSTETYEMTRNCTIWSGTGKNPVTIKLHGFTEKEDQKQLLQLIENFFKPIKEKQRKVLFYKSLNWIHSQLENGMKRRTRDQENELLIREEITR